MDTNIGKWMGIDYGDVRIGIAVSDPFGVLARGLETIRWNGQDMTWALERISYLVVQQQVTGLVIGMPRRTDGKPGIAEEKVRRFAGELAARTGLEPVLRDERYTTVLASRVMRDAGIRADRRKTVIDQIAAEIILQEYLESRRKPDS
jgi:putative Holliday junction resolvase